MIYDRSLSGTRSHLWR